MVMKLVISGVIMEIPALELILAYSGEMHFTQMLSLDHTLSSLT